MSSLRVGIVAEGRVDAIVIETALSHLFPGHGIVTSRIQPEFDNSSESMRLGAGWRGVLVWLDQQCQEFGSLQNSPLWKNNDVLVIHLDADVAFESEYAPPPPCPPASRVREAVRHILTRHTPSELPPGAVLCIPAMASETWALVGLYLKKMPLLFQHEDTQCRRDVKRLLSQQSKPRLVVAKDGELRNKPQRYEERRRDLVEAWPTIRDHCSQASRFLDDLQAAAPLYSPPPPG